MQREVIVKIGLCILVAVLMLEIPGYTWLQSTPEQKHELKVRLAKKFLEENGFCKHAKIWTVYLKDSDCYQIWMRCVDTERRL
jgi:hypothetical protein